VRCRTLPVFLFNHTGFQRPTLQVILLAKLTYNLIFEVSRLFDKEGLKGMKKEKPLKNKYPQLNSMNDGKSVSRLHYNVNNI